MMAAPWTDREHSMQKNDKIRPFKRNKDDLLDEIMDRKDPDDLGLLDLVLVEEMMNQKKQEKSS